MKSIKELIEFYSKSSDTDEFSGWTLKQLLGKAQEYHEEQMKEQNTYFIKKLGKQDKEIEELKHKVKRHNIFLTKDLDYISKADAKTAILMLCAEETAERLLKELGISEEVTA